MASNEDTVGVATWRDYDPDAADKAAKGDQKTAARSAAVEKKES